MATHSNPTVSSDRLEKLRDFWHLNAPSGGRRSRARAIGITLLIVALGAAGYFFVYVQNQRTKFDQERFQALARLAQNMDTLINNYEKVYQQTTEAPIFTQGKAEGLHFGADSITTLPFTTLFKHLPLDNRFEDYLLLDDNQILYQSMNMVLGGYPAPTLEGSTLETPYVETISLGGKNQRLYVSRSHSLIHQGQNLRIAGMVSENAYHRETLRSNPLLVLILTIVAGLVVICLPILKALIINEFESFNIRDILLSSLSLVVGVPVVLITLLGFWEQSEYQKFGNPSSLISLRQKIMQEFEQELRHMGNFMLDMDSTSNAVLEGYVELFRNGVQNSAFPLNKRYPVFNEALWMDENGQNQRIVASYMLGSLPENLSERNYFKAINSGNGWKSDHFESPWYLESVTSWATGHKEAVLSLPSTRLGTSVMALSTPMASMFQTILPSHTGFAVLDPTGKVLFHSQPERNTLENFLVELNYDPALQRLLTYHEPIPVRKGRYRGETIHFTGAQVGQAPLYIVAYKHVQSRYAFVANMVWVTLVLLLIALVIQGGLVLGNFLINRPANEYSSIRQTGFAWLRPQSRFKVHYQYIIAFIGLSTLITGGLLYFGIAHDYINNLVGLLLIAPTLVHLFQYRVLYLQPRVANRPKREKIILLISRLSLIVGLTVAAILFHNRNLADLTEHPYKWAMVIVAVLAINGSLLFLQDGHGRTYKTYLFQNLYLITLCGTVAELLNAYHFMWILAILLTMGELWFYGFRHKLVVTKQVVQTMHRHSGQPSYLFRHQMMLWVGGLAGTILPVAVLFMELRNLQEISAIKRDHISFLIRFHDKQNYQQDWLNDRLDPLQDAAREYQLSHGVYMPGKFNPGSTYYKRSEGSGAKTSTTSLNPVDSVLAMHADTTLRAENYSQDQSKNPVNLPEEKPAQLKFSRFLHHLLASINYDDNAFQYTQVDTTSGGAHWSRSENMIIFKAPITETKKNLFTLSTRIPGITWLRHWIDFVMWSLILALVGVLLLLLRYLSWQFHGFKYSRLPFLHRPPTPGELLKEGASKVLYVTPPGSLLYKEVEECAAEVMPMSDFEVWPEGCTALVLTELDMINPSDQGVDRLRTLLAALKADKTRQLILISSRFPSQILADYALMSGSSSDRDSYEVLEWMDFLSQFQEMVYPVGITDEYVHSWENPSLSFSELVNTERNTLPFFQNRQLPFVPNPAIEEHDAWSVFLPKLTNGAYTYYSHVWHSLSSKEQFLLYDLAEDGIVNPKNTTPMLSLMAKGLVVWDENYCQLRPINKTFTHFINAEVGKDEGQRIRQQMRTKGTWSSIRWIIMILLVAVISFVAISIPDFFENLDAVLALLAGVATIVPTITSFFERNPNGR